MDFDVSLYLSSARSSADFIIFSIYCLRTVKDSPILSILADKFSFGLVILLDMLAHDSST